MSLHVTTPFGELAKNEFLRKGGADPFRGSNCEISKDETSTAIRSRKIKIRETGCRQVTANAGIVRHPPAAVTPSDERAEHRMPDPGAGCAGSLIEIAGILMEQGWQYGAADHDVREIIERHCPQALAIGIPSLAVVDAICRLPYTGHAQNPGSGYRICRHFQRQLKFHLRRQRCRILFIRNVEVRHEAQYPLMFLRFELLNRDLDRVICNVDLCELGLNLQLNSRHDLELSRCERHAGRFPICKVRGTNSDLVRHSRLHVMKLERSIFRCSHRAAISALKTFQLNRGIGYRVTICVDCRADDDPRFQLWFDNLAKQARRNQPRHCDCNC